jgi:cbb3-type cytochrome oxidase subunit 3
LLRSCSGQSAENELMADFLVALGIIGFALVFLGLIWALDRV